MKNQSLARQITTLSLLLALQVVLGRVFALRLPAMGLAEGQRLSFVHIPLLMVVILYNPWVNLIYGLVYDLICSFLFPILAYNPLFTLFAGVVPMVLSFLWRLTPRRINWGCLGFLSLIYSVKSFFQTPFILWVSYGTPMVSTIPPRLLIWIIHFPLTVVILMALFKSLSRTGVLKDYQLRA